MDTVIPIDADWNEDFQEWLEPFLAVFKRSEQRLRAPMDSVAAIEGETFMEMHIPKGKGERVSPISPVHESITRF